MKRETKKQKLAGIINAIVVDTIMKLEASARGDAPGRDLWHDALAWDTVELADEFGIELPSLEHYRKHCAERIAALRTDAP